LHLEALLGGLVPSGSSVGQRAAVVTELADVLEKAAQRALRTSAEGGRAVLAALGEGDGAIEPFVGPDADPATDAARQKVRAIVRDLEPDLRAMTRHPDVGVRIRALSLLAKSDTDIAVAALVDGTTDADESVQRFAVAALGTRPSHGTAQVVAAAIRVLARNPVWSLRVMAAEGIARLARVAPELSRVAADDLEHAAEGDGFAVVREAALRALASVDPSRAVKLAQRLVVDDPEPRVQQAARAIAHPADATSSTPEGLPGK
jgi:HEAT repeat protein